MIARNSADEQITGRECLSVRFHIESPNQRRETNEKFVDHVTVAMKIIFVCDVTRCSGSRNLREVTECPVASIFRIEEKNKNKRSHLVCIYVYLLTVLIHFTEDILRWSSLVLSFLLYFSVFSFLTTKPAKYQ